MRKIVDKNCMTDPILEEFLQASIGNSVGLTEFVGMEAYKGDPVKNVCQSMMILCRYPKQVYILKGARQIIKENQFSNSSPEQLIDEGQTRGFTEFCEVIYLAGKRVPGAIAAIQEHGKIAKENMERLRRDAIKSACGIQQIIDTFSPKHLVSLRRHHPIPKGLADKIIKDILLLVALQIRDHLHTTRMPTAKELKNTYVFRYSTCAYLLLLDWLERGGLNKKTKPEKIRNDLIDMSYVAYATFYDGIISKDAKLNRIYPIAVYFLEQVFM